MKKAAGIASVVLVLAFNGCGSRGLSGVRDALVQGGRIVELPAGESVIEKPIVVHSGATLVGNPAGSSLRLSAGFQGTAVIFVEGAHNVTLRNFKIVGNRPADLRSEWALPLREAAFADYYTSNGIVVRQSEGVHLENVRFRAIRGFAAIVNASRDTSIVRADVQDCGTLNPAGKNNTTGGILIEEGSVGFEVRDSTFRHIAGNAIWTHSYARSPRQQTGVIAGNTISVVARDAIQVGHAVNVRVEKNQGSAIGFPVDQIDFAGYGTPVALDTAGNVDHSLYSDNHFTDVNGQCVNLDGFHDGKVSGNSCVNRKPLAAYPALHFGIAFGNHDPGMSSSNVMVEGNTLDGFAYGGVFLIGEHNSIVGNRLLNVTLAHCEARPVSAKCNAMLDEPDALRSGIYLSDNGGRVADTRDNRIQGNTIQASVCVAAKPGVNLRENVIGKNSCQ